MSIPKFILAATAAGGLAFFTAGGAGASPNGETAKIVLDEMCEERGGLVIWSPYSIARCQGARANRGFESERLICEGLADGRFIVTVSSKHMNRASWGCFATSPAT
jgi:hypothetical protein